MAVDPTDGWCAARRAVLLGLGVAGVTAVAGCGDDKPDPPATGDEVPPVDGGAASSAPGNPMGEPWPSDAPPVDTLVPEREVPVGGGVIVRNSIVVVQPRQGTFKAFEAKCPHQGTIIDPPLEGADVMICPAHNSKFKVGDGGLAQGPASRGLKAIAVKVQDGYVVEA